MATGGQGNTQRGRVAGRAFVELFTLSGLAVLQPMLDLLGKNADVFLVRRTSLAQAVALVVLVALVPPVVGTLVELVVGIVRPSLVRPLHAVLCALLVGVFALESIKQATSLTGTALVVLAVVLGALGGLLVVRFVVVRQFLHVLAIAPLVFALLFLTNSRAADVLSGTAASASAGSTTATPRSPHRVVLVVLDELPEMSLLDGHGRIDAELFPHFAELAAQSTWYRNTSTVAGFTAGAVPAILSGRYPVKRSALAVTSAYPRNLFTLLGSDYEMNVHEAVTHLCPTDLCRGSSQHDFGGLVNQSVDLWRAFASPNGNAVVQDEVDQARHSVGTAESFVDSLAPSTRPRLDFVHIEAPHFPWDRVASLQTYDPLIATTDPATGAALTTAPYFVWPAAVAPIGRQAHLLQVQAVDTLIGRIVDRLRTTKILDDALLVVTADHGAAFTPGEPLRNPSAGNVAQIMWPPLFVKYPGQKTGRIDDRPARSTDILPTIADVIGLRTSWHFDGASLRATPRAEGMRRLYPWVYAPGPRDLTPPAGREYVEVDGAAGFAEVLRSRAAPAGGSAALRLYRLGPYGSLVGRRTADLTTGTASGQRATLADPGRWQQVRRDDPRLSWFSNRATVGPLAGPEWVAVSVNGRVAALAIAVGARGSNADISFLVPPELVRDGRNAIGFAVVRGTPANPVLQPVTLRRG